jgi:hypothetical protein
MTRKLTSQIEFFGYSCSGENGGGESASCEYSRNIHKGYWPLE